MGQANTEQSAAKDAHSFNHNFNHNTGLADRRAPSRRVHLANAAVGLLLFLALGCGAYGGDVDADSAADFAGQPATAEEEIEIVAFGTAVYPLLREQCAECHNGSQDGLPRLADSDPEEAWWQVSRRELADFDRPGNSRLVERLARDRHHCWSDCVDDGLEMMGTIVAWQATIETMEREAEEDNRSDLEVDVPAAITREATGGLTLVTLDPPETHGGVEPHTITSDASTIGYLLGTRIVRWTVRDAIGSRVTVNQSVTIVDTTPPVVSPPPAIITNATGALTSVNLGIASAIDQVSGVVDVVSNAPAGFPVGTTTVVWSATDTVGNTAEAIQRVTVNEVEVGALMIVAPVPVVREASGVRTVTALGSATASGGEGSLVITNDAPAAGFVVGDHVVRWTVRDGLGDTSVATQQVRIVDTTDPVVIAPGNVAATATGQRTQVALGNATASDLVDANVAISNDAPEAGFVLGETAVTWTAQDDSGNTATAIQQVTINPAELVLTAPSTRTLEATGSTTAASLGDASVNGGTPPFEIENDAPSPGFSIGEHTVTWTVRDAQDATDSATQLVVIEDTTAPLLTAPSNVSVESDSVPIVVGIGTAQAADLSGSAIDIVSNAPGSGFSYGTTEVIWTATDAAGNVATASQFITVSEPSALVGDALLGAEAYAALCESCHSSNISTNVSGIQAGSTFAGIENALGSVTSMQSRVYLLEEPQTIADIAAYIASYESPPPPTSVTCEVDEDPMRASTLQRLSKVQYSNTVRDLLHRQLGSGNANAIFSELSDSLASIPADRVPDSFASLDQSVTADHIEGYLDVAFGLASAIVESDSLLIDFVGESCATNASDTACRVRFIESFGELVLRHPLDSDEVDFYAGAADYRDLIASLLMAPGFISLEQYRGDEDPDDSSRTVLSPYELASKLSYHFWQTMPDAALMASAASGEIETDFETVVTRVFNDARTRAAMPEFFGGWLQVDEILEFDLAKPERENFLTTDYGTGTDLPADLDLASYRQAAIDEVLALADYTTFVADGTLEDLFTSTDSFATDPMLARAYGVEPWAGGNSPPVPFDSSQPRSGLLSRAALQMYGDFNSHPLLKGSRIRRELLCDELSTPEDVSPPEESIIHPNDSTRERMEAITEVPNTFCAGCHVPLINPVGFPSESFDALGRHRTEEVLFDDLGQEFYRAAVRTDSIPRIEPDAPDAVNDAVGLGELMGASSKTSACFARHYYRFSQRRMEVDSTDRCEVDALETALDSEGIQGMLKAAALLPEFKLRVLPD